MPKTHDEPCSTCSSGPSWYIDNQDVKLAPNDKVEVKGSRITFDGHSAIVESEAKKGDEVLMLRNSSGFPRLERLIRTTSNWQRVQVFAQILRARMNELPALRLNRSEGDICSIWTKTQTCCQILDVLQKCRFVG